MQALPEYHINRCINGGEIISSAELHIFIDGGEAAYGAVWYTKFKYDDNTTCIMYAHVCSLQQF